MNEAELIKEMINKTGLNVRAFSKLAGIPYTTLRSMLDKDIGNASVNTALKVCAALDITIEELFNMSHIDTSKTSNSINATQNKEVLRRTYEMTLIPQYINKSEESNTISNNTKANFLKNTNNNNTINNEHIGMAVYSDYATDPDELLLIQKDLDEL